MSTDPRDEPDRSDPELFEEHFVARMSHRGRAVRVVVAFLVTLPGFVPVAYIGWGYGLVFGGPAAMLLLYAGMERQKRRVVLLWSIPTIVVLGLGLFSVVASSLQFGFHWDFYLPLFGVTVLTTLVAAWLGRPPSVP
jgi:hypothetical protein